MKDLLTKWAGKLPAALLSGSLIFVTLGAGAPHACRAQARAERPRPAPHRLTDWSVSPSFKFDALCFLNVMTGDPFYVTHYKEEYARFEPRLTPPVRAALSNLKRKIKDEGGAVVPAFLCLHFSATDDETLGEMLATLENASALERRLRRTTYFGGGAWRLFLSVRADLKIALSFLETIRFADYWRENVLPRAERKIAEMGNALPRYNVVPEIERAVGFALPSNRITVYLLFYSHPHGMRLTGTRFVANTGWPPVVVVQNAVHEMLHPPYDPAHDAGLRGALASLKGDAFLMGKIKNHNPSFGYNSLEAYVEEDCVRALEQLVQERLDIAREPRARWLDEDEGMHVFAAALYSLMKREDYGGRGESFRDFLVGAIRSGKLGAGNIEPAYRDFYRGPNFQQPQSPR
ncbi:MAG TPA: hypothetical protein VF538_04435 [Pyrinomonadaceae bacterium]